MSSIEGGLVVHRLESYYEEYVKRTWYTDKSLYDKTGRRIQYNQKSKNFVKVCTERRKKLYLNNAHCRKEVRSLHLLLSLG